MKEITKNTVIGDILDLNEELAPYFLEIGMHCLGCPSARSETVEEACQVHGVDADELVKSSTQPSTANKNTNPAREDKFAGRNDTKRGQEYGQKHLFQGFQSLYYAGEYH